MRYLRKSDESRILKEGWEYIRKGDRDAIRNELMREQSGYCAYSEKFLTPTESVDIEHFDNRLKPKKDATSSGEDSYWNWYAVLHSMNMSKPRKMSRIEPILRPQKIDLRERITYIAHQFVAIDPDDNEAKNLIEFLGWNKPKLAQERRMFVKRRRDELKKFYNDDIDLFRKEHLLGIPENLSFRSALEAEFGLLENKL